MNQRVLTSSDFRFLSVSLLKTRPCVQPSFAFALFILLLSGLVAPLPRANAQLPVETAKQNWYGELDAGIRVFRFEVIATLGRDGKWSGELNSLDEGGTTFRLEDVSIGPESFSFELKQTQAKFAGKIRESNTEGSDVVAEGEWTQRGVSLPLVFRRCEVMPEDVPTEVWIGDLNAGPQKLTMQFRVYGGKDTAGGERVFADSVSQRAGGFKASKKVGDNGETIFDVPSLKGKFIGTPDSDGHLKGKWSQGASLELELKKADRPIQPTAVVRKRPQMPTEPIPYTIRNVQIKGSDSEVMLAGTLTIPEGATKENRVPAAVLISGSGPQDRDETLLGHKPFLVLADYLTRRGVAVLRYDDRGVGQSTGEFGKATSEHFAEDAWSAFQFLIAQEQVDASKVGLIGHSEGGIVAPLVAASHSEVAWIVLLAGTGVNGEQILYSQGEKILLADGGSAEDAMQQRIVQENIIRVVKGISADESTDTHVNSIVDSILADARWNAQNSPIADGAALRDVLKTQVSTALLQMNSPWFRYFISHEPAEILERVHCPVLAMNGELDLQVVPELNLPVIEEALKAGGNSKYRIVKLPGLNHLFQTCKTGSPSEYEQIEETMAPVAMETVKQFILEVTHGNAVP